MLNYWWVCDVLCSSSQLQSVRHDLVIGLTQPTRTSMRIAWYCQCDAYGSHKACFELWIVCSSSWYLGIQSSACSMLAGHCCSLALSHYRHLKRGLALRVPFFCENTEYTADARHSRCIHITVVCGCLLTELAVLGSMYAVRQPG
jgi:hypothetical protein